MNALANQHCTPLESHGALRDADIAKHLSQAPGWLLMDGTIQKHHDFKNYHHTLAFVNAVAWIAHSEDHHPDMLVTYNNFILAAV